MVKVGQFVSDPRAGAYCRIMLDGGEKVVVYHEKGGFTGGQLTIEAAVEFVREAGTLAELRTRYAALSSGR